ncbi:MAG: peptidoglycan editing factor PgeF [Calditrichaceae bacterium]
MLNQTQNISSDHGIEQFKIFKRYRALVHGFSTRKGGESKPPFDQLNLGFNTPDSRTVVQTNRELYFDALEVSEDLLAFPEQVHSSNIQIARGPGVFKKTDALVTNLENLFLTVQTADCFPVFIFDPVKKAVGLVHSGWRGTAQNITGKTIDIMRNAFNSHPENLLIAIGPGVQQNCYQVDDDTASNFSPDFLIADGPGHHKLDVQKAIISQIIQKGVSGKNLEINTACTHCAKDRYFSYRRDRDKSGRMMGVIGLKNRT